MAGILRVDQANVDYIYAKTAGGKIYMPGHVIQVVSSNYSSQYTRSSMNNTWAASPLSASITPTSINSKVLIIITTRTFGYSSHNGLALGILRNGSLCGSRMHVGIGDSYGYAIPMTLQYLDSPATTSSTTYALGSNDTNNDGGAWAMNRSTNYADGTEITAESNIVLMEIAQ